MFAQAQQQSLGGNATAAKLSDASDCTSLRLCARVCLCIYVYNTRTHTHTDGAVDRLYHTLLCHKKIEIAPGLYDANLLRGNTVLPETGEIIKQQTS